jgi:hydrogenase expression/formation protein HypC
VCLAIPGQVVEIVDADNRLATVEVAGVRRKVNIGLLDDENGGDGPGDWVLIHVGCALDQVDEEEARATRTRSTNTASTTCCRQTSSSYTDPDAPYA